MSHQNLRATSAECERRDAVISRVIDHTLRDEKIKLPSFHGERATKSLDFALQTIADNDFSGSVGPYRYQIEGEDDLLHLIVVRADGAALTPEEGRAVAGFVLDGVPPAVIWLRPGELSQHFYVGHDELLNR